MILTIVLLILAGAVLVAVLAPLWRGTAAVPARGRYDRAVYRDQLQEIERDAARGLVSEADAASARREIERRIIAAGDAPETLQPGVARPKLAIGLGVGTVIGALLLYGWIGAPGLPDLPFAHRIPPEQQMKMVKGMVDSLAARLQQKPDDVDGWVMLGRSYSVLGDSAKAADAYEHAHALKPDDPGIALNEAEMLLADRKLEDPIPEHVTDLLRGVEARDPDQPTALWLLGMAAAQRHDLPAARQYWQHLLRVMPSNAPERQTVTDALAAINGKR